MRLDASLISRILSEISSREEHERRAAEIESKEIYEGKLHRYIESKLKKMYPKTWEAYNVADYNIHKKICDKKSKSYIKPPLRKLDKESETETFNNILEESGFNDVMKKVDLYKNRHNYCGIGVIRERFINEETGEAKDSFNFWALAPYEFCVHRDVNGNIYAWSLPTGMIGNSEVWTIWTNESHIKIKTENFNNWEHVEIPGNEEGVNPYGVIPFIYVPMDTAGAYPYPSSLPRQTVELNTNLSVYLTSGNMQIGQLVIKHPKSQKFDWVVNGLMTAMKLEQETKADVPRTEAEYISPNPNLEGHKDSILTFMLMILDEHGMNANQSIKGGERFSSGFDRLIANADVQDTIEDNQDVYTRAENQVFQIIKAMSLRDGNFTFASRKLNCRFARPKVLSSDTEKLSNLKSKKELGLWEEWQLLQESDPNLTEADAKKILEERAAAKALDAKSVFNGAQVSSLVEVVKEVGFGNVPVESGVQILISSFGMNEEQARLIINDKVKTNAKENGNLEGNQAASSFVAKF